MNLKTFNQNTDGRDFVVGDLHGAYALLDAALNHVNFDPSKDRLFSVGDLFDRGPDNMKCLGLLDQPWFHAVYSNHDDLMVNVLNGSYPVRFWYQNGGDWYLHLSQDDKYLVDNHYLKLIDDLPYVITVNGDTKFHIIHAEFYDTVSDDILADPNGQGFLGLLAKQSMDGQAIIWGRSLFQTIAHRVVDQRNLRKLYRGVSLDKRLDIFDKDMSTVYCGHTPVFAPVKLGPCVNIDTGAYWALRDPNHNHYGLTLVQPSTNTFWKSSPKGVFKS